MTEIPYHIASNPVLVEKYLNNEGYRKRIHKQVEDIRLYKEKKAKQIQVAPEKPIASAPINRKPLDCAKRGEATGKTVVCATCGGNVQVKLFGCDEFGDCTLGKKVEGHACCNDNGKICEKREAPKPCVAVTSPKRITKIDLGSGRKYNGSLIRHKGQLLLAHRIGWPDSTIGIARLDENLRPTAMIEAMRLIHPECAQSQEDPRLFTYLGRLYLTFAGIKYAPAGPKHITVMMAALKDDLSI